MASITDRDRDRDNYMTQLATYIEDNYNFNNISLHTIEESRTFIKFTAKFNISTSDDQYIIKFKIAWHPSYNEPCIFFQIFEIATDEIDDDFEYEKLIFDNLTLHKITNSRQFQLLKNSSSSSSSSIPSHNNTTITNSDSILTSQIALYTDPSNIQETSYFIHPCQMPKLRHSNNKINSTATKFRWFNLFISILGVY